jgi:hypothetical protein
MESVVDMVGRLDSMASGEPSWDLSDNDMSALKHALQFVPGSDFYKPPAAENQGGPDSASYNTGSPKCCRSCAKLFCGCKDASDLRQDFTCYLTAAPLRADA